MTISINSNVIELINILLNIYIYFKREKPSKTNWYIVEIRNFIEYFIKFYKIEKNFIK